MTTKLTEADVKALPVCKCGELPKICDNFAGCTNPKCPISRLNAMSNETWRLLMTPEAKGEKDISIHDAVERLNKAITSVKHDWVHASAERDSLQSKLAKSEEWVEKLQTELMCEKDGSAMEWQKVTNENSLLEATLKETTVHRDNLLNKFVAMQQQLIDARLQLAEATKPVGDEELEKAIKFYRDWRERHRDASTVTFHPGSTIDINIESFIRAARQRKPSEWTKGEPPKDTYSLCYHGEACHPYIDTHGGYGEYRVTHWMEMPKPPDSILAQAAAEDSGPPKFVTASTEGVARVPAADPTVGVATDYGYVQAGEKQDDHLCFKNCKPLTVGNGVYFINFDAKRILNDTNHHEPVIRWTTPEETKDVERRRKYPKVIFSGIDATQYDFHRAEQAVRAILGDFQLVLDSFTFLPRKENEPHADAYDSVPDADFNKAMRLLRLAIEGEYCGCGGCPRDTGIDQNVSAFLAQHPLPEDMR